MMRTVGVDLAAAGTGLAAVDWTPGHAAVVDLRLGIHDEDVVAAMSGDAVLGLDCPVGWPDAFVDFVTAVRRGERIERGDAEHRRTLVYRATDAVVHGRVGRWPLSVSADRLGVTAMRGAALLTALQDAGVEVDRSGRRGRVFEVYPAAALRLWGFDARGYKVDPSRRQGLLDALSARAPWLDIDPAARGLMVRSADAFDAVLSALIARAAALGRFAPAPADLVDQASREGWVVLPDVDLADLPDPASARRRRGRRAAPPR